MRTSGKNLATPLDPNIFVFFREKIFSAFCWTEVASARVVKVHLGSYFKSQQRPSGGTLVKIHNCDVVLMQFKASVSGTSITDTSTSK